MKTSKNAKNTTAAEKVHVFLRTDRGEWVAEAVTSKRGLEYVSGDEFTARRAAGQMAAKYAAKIEKI